MHQFNEYNEQCCSHQEIYCFYCQPVDKPRFLFVMQWSSERTQYFKHILHLEHINDILFTNIFDIDIYGRYYYYWMYVYETITQWILRKKYAYPCKSYNWSSIYVCYTCSMLNIKLKFAHQGWWFFVIVRFHFVNNELWQKRDVATEILINIDSSELDSWNEMTQHVYIFLKTFFLPYILLRYTTSLRKVYLYIFDFVQSFKDIYPFSFQRLNIYFHFCLKSQRFNKNNKLIKYTLENYSVGKNWFYLKSIKSSSLKYSIAFS